MLRELQRAFAADLDVSRLNRALDSWSRRFPVLSRFESIQDLETFYREHGSDDEKAEVVVPLALLCREGDEAAKILIAELFMPALYETLNHYRGGLLTADEIESEMGAAFWDAVASTDQDTPKPLAKLGRRPADRVRDAIQRQLKRAERELPIDELQELAERTPWPQSRPARRPVLGDREARLLEQARDEGIITELERQVIALTQIEGFTVEEARERLGEERSTEALAALRRRAQGLLAAWIQGEEPPPRRKV